MAAAVLVCGCAAASKNENFAAQTAPSVSRLKGENCGLQVPPKRVPAENLGGVLVFIYPKTISVNYTGCQTLWAVSYDIKMRSIIFFKNSIPAAYERYVNNEFNSCKINKEEEKKESSDFTCPGYDAVNQMQKTYQQAIPYDGEIPHDIDPRR
jgi:hypothetical protein